MKIDEYGNAQPTTIGEKIRKKIIDFMDKFPGNEEAMRRWREKEAKRSWKIK